MRVVYFYYSLTFSLSFFLLSFFLIPALFLHLFKFYFCFTFYSCSCCFHSFLLVCICFYFLVRSSLILFLSLLIIAPFSVPCFSSRFSFFIFPLCLFLDVRFFILLFFLVFFILFSVMFSSLHSKDS